MPIKNIGLTSVFEQKKIVERGLSVLTAEEINAAREKLHQARALIERLHVTFVSGQHVHGARVANEITGLMGVTTRKCFECTAS